MKAARKAVPIAKRERNTFHILTVYCQAGNCSLCPGTVAIGRHTDAACDHSCHSERQMRLVTEEE